MFPTAAKSCCAPDIFSGWTCARSATLQDLAMTRRFSATRKTKGPVLQEPLWQLLVPRRKGLAARLRRLHCCSQMWKAARRVAKCGDCLSCLLHRFTNWSQEETKMRSAVNRLFERLAASQSLCGNELL